ncbi:Uncharacterised protein [Vibrio cholerae]|nr:Uncharacterised protein [Vibrio cholerae]
MTGNENSRLLREISFNKRRECVEQNHFAVSRSRRFVWLSGYPTPKCDNRRNRNQRHH